MLKLLVAFKQRLQRAALAPILEQNERLVQRQEEALRVNNRTLEQFASALRDCAEQLSRHTEAVKSMAEASQELRNTVREINECLRLGRDATGTLEGSLRHVAPVE
ncbi:MAG: hypothetical protein Q7J06_01160 [Bacteroidales bacterium]|nr:hypothetical protein [Bacteroidales bacterium]